MRSRDAVLRLCGATYGLAVAISLQPLIARPAPAAQMPGAAAAAGIDARASFIFIAACVLLPIASSLALSFPLRRLLEPGVRQWAVTAAGAALVSSLWVALIDQNLLWTAIPPLLVAGAAVGMRRHRARFSRRDAILLPVVAAVFLALFDLLPRLVFHQHLVLAALLVLALRLALAAIGGRRMHVANCFAAAPLALALQSHFNGYEQRHNGWPVLAVALVTPMALRLLLPDTPRSRRRIRLFIGWFAYPVAALMYVSAVSPLAAEGKPHADLFENAHHLTPGNELRRGELPYRDIIPAHGLIADGLLDALILGAGEPEVGRVLEARGVIGSFTAIAVYALGAALTGSPDFGILTFFLAVFTGAATGGVRALPALCTLAVLVAAVRKRRAGRFAAAGAGTVVAALTSLDFGAYTLIALIVAILRVRRRAAWAAAAAGFGGAALVAAIMFAWWGLLDDVLRFTFVEVAALGAVYALPFTIPPSLQGGRFFPDVIAAVFDPVGFLWVIWIAGVIALAVLLTRRRGGADSHRAAVRESIIVLLVWMAAAAISYAERHHYYFHFIVPAIVAGAAYLLVKLRTLAAGLGAAAIVLIAIIAARPTHDLIVLSMLRRAHGPLSPEMVEVRDIPRAGGALYRRRDAEVINIAGSFINRTLAAGETFFDFTNRGALYFLLDRDVPIRQVEVAFYESEAAQREVIAAIRANPRVRLALVPAAGDAAVNVDGVPNETRAPLVWDYLRSNFTPIHEERGVVFWQRSNTSGRR
jgi:hypothetical protein